MRTTVAALTPAFAFGVDAFFGVGEGATGGGGGVAAVVVVVAAAVVVVAAAVVVVTTCGEQDSEPVTGSTLAGTRLSASYGGSLSSPATRSYVWPFGAQ